jgi:GNAT superfamily N-acetyltransferase
MIRVVRAGPGDRSTVLALVEKLLKELEDSPDEFQGIERGRIFADLESAGSRFMAFLAVSALGEPVGVITLFEAFAIYAGGNYGVIDEMYVAPEHRARGVGKRLLEAVTEEGRRKGWIRIDVTAPPERKWERTVKFYESQGFVFTGPKMRLRLKDEAP